FHSSSSRSFLSSGARRHLHSFPTRRSSDLQRGFTQSRRAEDQYVVQRFLTAPGSGDENFHLLANRRLTHILRQQRRANSPIMHLDRKSTRLNSSHVKISYAVFCLKKQNALK